MSRAYTRENMRKQHAAARETARNRCPVCGVHAVRGTIWHLYWCKRQSERPDIEQRR